MKIHYINDTLLSGQSANKVARINMIKGFLNSPKVSTVYVYYLLNSSQTPNLEEIIGSSQKLISKPVQIKGYIDENEHSLTALNKALNLIRKVFVVIRFFLIFLSINPNDYIFIRGQKCLVSLIFARLLKKVPYGLEIHNFSFSFNPVINLFYKKAMSDAKFLVTISEHTKSIWVNNGIDSKKIFVLPSGVDLAMFDAVSDDKVCLRKRLGMPFDTKVTTYAGSLGESRGVEEIIYSASVLPEVFFIIIGGSLEQVRFYENIMLKDFSKILDNVLFTGQLPAKVIPQYLKASNVLLAPYSKSIKTVDHMSPIKLFEYMASNVPMIVSDLPRIRDVLNDGDACFFEADNKMQLATKIKDLLSNDELQRTLSRNSYDKVKKHSWDERAHFIISQFS